MCIHLVGMTGRQSVLQVSQAADANNISKSECVTMAADDKAMPTIVISSERRSTGDINEAPFPLLLKPNASMSSTSLPCNNSSSSGGSAALSSHSRDNKWAKVRATVKLVGALSHSHQRQERRKASTMARQDSFLKRFSTRHGGSSLVIDENQHYKEYPHEPAVTKRDRPSYVVKPEGNVLFYWLAVVTVTVMYNLWTCIAREAFHEIWQGREVLWFVLDATTDIVYLADIGMQMRTGYLEKGLIVYDSRKLVKHYIYSKNFVLDLVSLLPLDFAQIAIGIHPLIRFPRFLKAYRSIRFNYMVVNRTVYPNMWRVTILSHLLLLGSHWFAGFYFMISKADGFSGKWGYPKPEGEFASVTRKYLKSLYWSTLTLTTIGDLPPPDSNWDRVSVMPLHWYVFTIVSYLIGVFIFAAIVGQVGNVIANRNANRLEFERLLDGAKSYMRNHNVPPGMQHRVQRWYNYAWSRGRMNGGGDINSLGLLPDKLKTELALHVNLETLKKVTIFQECEPEFLHDMVLKMKAFIFTPGDLICRKGEVAREMFIIADGLLEVISESGDVLTRMGSGDFFGEIGILNLDRGVNRRTADVRSVGYAELFVLSREDVLTALKDHPDAEAILTKHGRSRLSGLRRRSQHSELICNQVTSVDSQRDEANPSPVTNLLGIHVPRRQPAMAVNKEKTRLMRNGDVRRTFSAGENQRTVCKHHCKCLDVTRRSFSDSHRCNPEDRSISSPYYHRVPLQYDNSFTKMDDSPTCMSIPSSPTHSSQSLIEIAQDVTNSGDCSKQTDGTGTEGHKNPTPSGDSHGKLKDGMKPCQDCTSDNSNEETADILYAVKRVVEERMRRSHQKYKSRIEQLEHQNKLKQSRIRLLETQISQLQMLFTREPDDNDTTMLLSLPNVSLL